jgi:hypothetical protein
MAIGSASKRDPSYNPYAGVPPGAAPRALPPARQIEPPVQTSLQSVVNTLPDDQPRPVQQEITEDDYFANIMKANITNDATMARVVIKTVMQMPEYPDPESKAVLMIEAIKYADYLNILATQVANVQKGDVTVEDIVNRLPQSFASQILNKSFNEWLAISRAFEHHPTLGHECKFLNGEGLGTAQIIYEAISAKQAQQNR